jgi:urease accessory protein
MLELAASGAVVQLRRGARLAPRILGRSPGGVVHAAFVPTQAGPLSGDEDRARIVVGAGATLIVEPVAATLALPGDARTLLELQISVQKGGRLVLDEAPLIVAAGAFVERRFTLELDEGAIAALRETVVLGRDGEPPGTLVSTTRATLGGRALLHDGLQLGPGRADEHVALPPGHRVVSTACLLGAVPAGPQPPGAYALAAAGALHRATGPSLAAIDTAIGATWSAWADRTTWTAAAQRVTAPGTNWAAVASAVGTTATETIT